MTGQPGRRVGPLGRRQQARRPVRRGAPAPRRSPWPRRSPPGRAAVR
nr:hypothetical protein [Angustibacter aerolatus]